MPTLKNNKLMQRIKIELENLRIQNEYGKLSKRDATRKELLIQLERLLFAQCDLDFLDKDLERVQAKLTAYEKLKHLPKEAQEEIKRLSIQKENLEYLINFKNQK